MQNRYAIIMAGGVGERFWPVSRKNSPKHLHAITGTDNMLKQTFDRLSECVGYDRIFVITSAPQAKAMQEKCPFLSPDKIIVEPCGRDTCAAVALAAKLVKRLDKEAVFGVFPADQTIADKESFKLALNTAFELASLTKGLFTIGVKPTFPATGYGYIDCCSPEEFCGLKYYRARRFVEKPDLPTAEKYIASGSYFWNAGMFVWTVDAIEKALGLYAPEVFEPFGLLDDKSVDFLKTLSSFYSDLKKISIDFAVMEKADNIYCLPAPFDWDDVGSWTALERHRPKDKFGNVAVGNAVFLDSNSNTVFDADGRFTAVLGLDNVVVVHTKDATLVCDKKSAEKIKSLLKIVPEELK